MNDIEIMWIDDKNLICKVIYSKNVPYNHIKNHLNEIADSEFFENLKAQYSVMVVGCIRNPTDTNIVNNHITMHEDGGIDVSSAGTVQVELKDEKKIFSVDTDLSDEDIKHTVDRFKHAMKFITD